MLGGGVFVKQNNRLPGSFINFQTNKQSESGNNDFFGQGGIPDTCREVIEARGTDKTLKDRLDRMEAQKGGRKEIVDYTPTWDALSPGGLVNVETPELHAVTGTLTTYTLEGE